MTKPAKSLLALFALSTVFMFGLGASADTSESSVDAQGATSVAWAGIEGEEDIPLRS